MSEAAPETIINWLRLDARLTTSGQPTEAQLPILQGLGVKHVINLALHSHEQSLADEAASLGAFGIGYTHLPVEYRNPMAADFTRFREAFESLGDAPLHVHCILNYRVSAFMYRYRRQVLGLSDGQARPDLEKIWQPDAVWTALIESRG